MRFLSFYRCWQRSFSHDEKVAKKKEEKVEQFLKLKAAAGPSLAQRTSSKKAKGSCSSVILLLVLFVLAIVLFLRR